MCGSSGAEAAARCRRPARASPSARLIQTAIHSATIHCAGQHSSHLNVVGRPALGGRPGRKHDNNTVAAGGWVPAGSDPAEGPSTDTDLARIFPPAAADQVTRAGPKVGRHPESI